MRRDLTRLIAFIVAALLGIAQTGRAENWLRPKELTPHARFTADQGRQYPQDNPFADDETVQAPTTAQGQSQPEAVEAMPEQIYPEDAYSLGWLGDEMGLSEQVYPIFPMFAPHSRLRFFAGSDFIHLRPSFSQAVAYRQIDGFDDTTETLVPFEFGYHGAVRSFLGFRLCDCNAEVRFGYSSVENDIAQRSPSALGEASSERLIIGNGGISVATREAGDYIQSFASVKMNTYDIDFSKRILFNQPPMCDGGDCRPCAPWDVTWTIGIRFADILWENTSLLMNSDDELQIRGANAMAFSGVGPKLALQANRYFGHHGRFSLFGRGAVGLIIGDYRINSVNFDVRDDDDYDTDTKHLSTTRTVPMLEMELGGRWAITHCCCLSGGYMWQAWVDLGMANEFCSCDVVNGYANSNILAFDGFFFRGEWKF